MLPINNKLEKFINSNRAHVFVAILIILNAITLGAETYESMRPYLSVIQTIDQILLCVFVVELSLRILAGGFRFLRCGWNLFDMVTILVSVVSTLPVLSVLRVVRIIRIMRLISIFPQMRMVISAIYMAIPGIFSVACLLCMMFYVFSVLAYNLFHDVSPEMFNSLGGSMYTLFQLMLGDEWSNTTRPILEKMPYSWLFFIPFIIIMAFSMLNLFFGLIVNAMQKAADKENEEALANIQRAKENQGKFLDSNQNGADRIDALEAKVDTLLVGIQTLNKRFDV